MSELKVRDVGEQGLLTRLFQYCAVDSVGDDAAVLSVREGRSLVVTEDMLVDGVHFSLGLASPGVHTTSPFDAGWRAMAANLSDLAAMGATPMGITVGLGVPGDLPVSWLEDLYKGMVACLEPWNTSIVGGDVCRSPVLTVAIAAFGDVLPGRVIRRAAAQPGDVILVTGLHGASRAGLELLLHPEQGEGLDEGDRRFLIQAHQRPQARLDILSILDALIPPPTPFRIAGMDSSDGLADAVLQICRASGVGAVLERSHIPIPPALAQWLSSEKALEWSLYGGEDFELVLCLPQELAEEVGRSLPNTHMIGKITFGNDVILMGTHQNSKSETLNLARGFQHFSTS
ncbi:thiamine-phosphate kinase [Leptolyngbya sp. FACHB-8]|uniref:thiamine-phosphate kinase n=1 Tax=unclassified Leptolyngbya TaxID=2650499 RepID=UPI0016892124|nr:thiamine-phosphate kinase [Leptolyngbya sp. FACHB-8]MBD1912218.1 thiamine-phosphate kinase [Leptolyngbya sp. FACHB-8]